jgi:Nucleotidyl transferase AbiEii toxin, Type IV TA system
VSPTRYADPPAFRRALTERLRTLARQQPDVQLQDLQRQFASDRLLSRIFTTDPDRWVLKGATALLARLEGVARHTRDIDLYHLSGDLAEAEAILRDCAAVDLGDWFRFELAPGRTIAAQGAEALRVPVVAYVGATVFANFHVDLVTDLTMTGTPEDVPPLVPIEMDGLTRVLYRAYPAVDHIADKLCALVELHPRASGAAEPSSRYRDLADLVSFAHNTAVDAASLSNALRSEERRRGLVLPDHVAIPRGGDWPSGYARVARDAPGLLERDLASALATASRFLDPILARRATGRWDPLSLSWA